MKIIHVPTGKITKKIPIPTTYWSVFGIMNVIEKYGDTTGIVNVLILPGTSDYIIKIDNDKCTIIAQTDEFEAGTIGLWVIDGSTKNETYILFSNIDNEVRCQGNIDIVDKVLLKSIGEILNIKWE